MGKPGTQWVLKSNVLYRNMVSMDLKTPAWLSCMNSFNFLAIR